MFDEGAKLKQESGLDLVDIETRMAPENMHDDHAYPEYVELPPEL